MYLSERDTFWRWVLRVDRDSPQSVPRSFNTIFRACPYCEARISINEPDAVWTVTRPHIGHDTDCAALALALTLDDTPPPPSGGGDPGGGGGGGGGEAPMFGSLETVFGSTDPVFGEA